MQPNKALVYKGYTPHRPVAGEHLAVEDRPFDAAAPPPPGGITLRTTHLSLDPWMRGQMRAPGDDGTYSIPWVEDRPALVTLVGTVLKSDSPAARPGELVFAMADAAEYAAVGAELMPMVRPVPAAVRPAAALGALGVAGLSAYGSFHEFVGEPRAGRTFWVSAASGGVGQVVGQMAKMHGMKVIGSTGSQEKVDYLVQELGFDGAWNYKAERTADALARLAPEGIDVYYDNVGGEQLETALTRMRDFGTVVSSGMVSACNFPDEEKYGIRTGMNIFLRRLTVHGFVCSDARLVGKYMAAFVADMSTWLAEGKIKTREEVLVGIDRAPEGLLRMWSGDKFGKMVIQVAGE